jgi:hypothetical protein
MQLPTLKAFLANCLIWGEEATHKSDGSWARDVISVSCNGWTFVFRQNSKIVGPPRQIDAGQAYETSIVEIHNVDSASRENVLAVLDSICWLLTFATQSRVIRFGWEFPEGDVTSHYHTAPGVVGRSRPLFELADAKAYREFVEMTYAAYGKLHSKRKLPVVFDYLLQTQLPLQTMEASLLLLFVALENLKDTYASGTGIPYSHGFYRKATPAGHKGRPPHYSFKELLEKMFNEVGMAPDLKPMIELRNEIVHSGLSRTPYAEQRRLYDVGHDLIREYVLRLLEFRGTYFLFSSSDHSPHHLP